MSGSDTAWMLVATALVLLMTPALAFFYGGLVRAKNALNTMMMSVASLGFVGVAWALLGYSLAFAPEPPLVGGLRVRLPRRRRPRAAGHDPAPALHGLPGHVRDHHGGAHLGRDRRADALRGLPRLHHALDARRLRAGGALGLGRRLPRRSSARSTSPAAPSSTSTPATAALVAAIVHRPAEGLRAAGDPAAQRPLHAARRGPALVRLVRLQRRAARSRRTASAALAFVNTMLAPAATLVVWTLLDLVRNGKATAVGAATGIVVGLVAITPAAGFVGPHGRPRPRRRSPPSRATSRSSTARGRGSTTRSTSSPRTASAAPWARS